MGVTVDIARTWRHPRQVMARLLGAGVREDRALIILMTACLLIFIGQWPSLVRQAHFDPSTPLDARMGGALMAWLFIVPLVAYGMAAIARILAKILGGQGSWYSARLALFWSLLAAAPFWLAFGLARGFTGSGTLINVLGLVAFLAFLIIWLMTMIQAETGKVKL